MSKAEKLISEAQILEKMAKDRRQEANKIRNEEIRAECLVIATPKGNRYHTDGDCKHVMRVSNWEMMTRKLAERRRTRCRDCKE